ncbi:hypothetical protein BD413DRAFT_525363 [Trametes elegans]|nr:hypothetical protein BD413DRAFT_525363 [Trametes elegans]
MALHILSGPDALRTSVANKPSWDETARRALPINQSLRRTSPPGLPSSREMRSPSPYAARSALCNSAAALVARFLLLHRPSMSVPKNGSPSVPMAPTGPFPKLPSEIVIQIFEATACTSREGAHTISLVCSWARKIALPHLFATIVHRTQHSFSATLSSGENNHPQRRRPSVPLRWGHLVRNLWTENMGFSVPSAEEDLFGTCPNVENLALMSSSLRAVSQAIQTRSMRAVCLKDAAREPFLHRLWSLTLITHTFRYDWHFLVGTQLHDGSQLLHNITHLRILDMKISSFCPHNLLPNLTHLALPYLDLGNDLKLSDTLRLPSGVLEHKSLQMVVLTVAEDKWLTNPWYQIARYPGKNTASPRETFRALALWARQRDERLHVVLSPRRGVEPCSEWADAARGGQSLWELAAEARSKDSYACGLPEVFPKTAAR